MIFLSDEFKSAENDAFDCFVRVWMAGQRLVIFTLLDLIMLGIGTAALRDGFVDVDWHRVVFLRGCCLRMMQKRGQSTWTHRLGCLPLQ